MEAVTSYGIEIEIETFCAEAFTKLKLPTNLLSSWSHANCCTLMSSRLQPRSTYLKTSVLNKLNQIEQTGLSVTMMRKKSTAESVKMMTSPAKKPSMEKIKSRLVECRRSQRLNFSCLDMVEIPPKFMNQANAAGVTNILELDLHRNFISMLPLELVALQTLRVLKLDHNRFHEIPNIIFSFQKLQILSISNNSLKEIDPSLANLSQLRELDLSKNDLTVIPTFYLNMPLLASFNLAYNNLSSVPSSLGAVRSLQYLDLSHNKLCELPRDLQNLQQLSHLDIHENCIRSLPSIMSHLKMLQKLNCDGNPLREQDRSIYLQGFDNYMGYLRTIYEEEQSLIKAQSRPMPTTQGSFVKFRTSRGSGNWPVLRTGHTVTQVNTKTFVFGGFIKKYGKVDELFTIDFRTMIWTEPTTNGCPPCARDGHCAAFDGEYCLYFFGGMNDEQKLLNDLFYLDLRSMTWTKPLVDGTLPSVREGAGMVVVADHVILFGGHGVHFLFNDVHVLDTKTWNWTAKSTKGLRPSPRQNIAVFAEENLVYIHGGRANLVFSDMYVLDVSNYIWSKINQTGLEPRYGHILWLHNTRFFVTGGFNRKHVAETSLYVMQSRGIIVDRKISDCQAILMLLQEYSSVTSLGSVPSITCKTHHEVVQAKDQLCWNEVEYGIKLHDTHILSFSKEKIIVIQTDHEILEESNSMQLDNVHLHWDVYLEAPIDSFSIKATARGESELLSNKTDRVLQQMCKSLKHPKSFQSLSAREADVVRHVRRFIHTFMQQFPERRPLILMILNECGTQKFICSSIRPSQTIFTDFYDWEAPTIFLSKYLVYECLPSPTNWPTYIPSPQSVLEWSQGDCFDFSIVLTSLLVGVGYDALCVVGLAPFHVTTNNQETIRYSLEETRTSRLQPDGLRHEQARQTYMQDSSPLVNARFLGSLRQNRNLLVKHFVQNFLQHHDEELMQGQTDEQDILLNYINDKTVRAVHSSDLIPKALPSQSMDHSAIGFECLKDLGRLHCWVMVVAGKRDVVETFFLEPSTGCRYSQQNSPYKGVELVFNHSNAWINVQSKFQSEVDNIQTLSWSFKDSSKWEKVFESNQLGPPLAHSSEKNETSGNVAHAKAKAESNSSNAFCIPTDEIEYGTREAIVERVQDVIAGEDIKICRVKTKLNFNVLNYSNARIQWKLPLSWVPKLVIPMEGFVTRFPKGAKRTYYYRCEHFLFAFYGAYMRCDGLVERVMFYADDERSDLNECHDYFQRRKDRLVRRVYTVKQRKVQEYFAHGTIFGIKEITTIHGQSQKFIFYIGSRVDGLLERQETFCKHLTEVYNTQNSYLVHQTAHYDDSFSNKDNSPIACKKASSVKYKGTNARTTLSSLSGRRFKTNERSHTEARRIKSGGRTKALASSSNGGVSKPKVKAPSVIMDQHSKNILSQSPPVYSANAKRPPHKLVPITQITQRYLRSINKDRDLEKTIYGSNYIQVDFHYVNGHMTASSRLYEKNGSCRCLHVDPFQPILEDFERVDEFLKLIVSERENMQKIRDSESETNCILEQRALEEQNVVILAPYTDIGMHCTHDIEDQKDTTKVDSDYLSSFFPTSINPRQHLSRPQMILVRDNCLKALKDRLLRRAYIIQVSLDTEISNLAKRRASFERDQEGLTVAEEEDYERSCEKAKFRIRILQQRQKYHEDKSLQKYTEMETKLRNDYRFSSLYEG